MYESVATLKSPATVTYDSAGNEIMTYNTKLIYVQPRSVYSSEFYQAAQAGLHPSITFEITNRADYNGEKLLEWNGAEYDILRADWTGMRDALRLVCQERIGRR